MNFAIGVIITVGSILGGYAALGGHLEVLAQPYEFLIIAGSALGIFIVANPTPTIKDCGSAIVEAVFDKAPKPRDFLDVLSVLHALMRELRAKPRSEVEAHFDNPRESEIFKNFPKLLANKDLVTFICDYGRLIIIGNARTHEIEALMDEEIETLAQDRYKPSNAVRRPPTDCLRSALWPRFLASSTQWGRSINLLKLWADSSARPSWAPLPASSSPMRSSRLSPKRSGRFGRSNYDSLLLLSRACSPS